MDDFMEGREEFDSETDRMLYGAYVDGRKDEREEIIAMILERIEDCRLPSERAGYIDVLLRLSKPVKTEESK